MATARLPDGTEFTVTAECFGTREWTAEGLAIHRDRNPVLRDLVSEYELAKAFGLSLRALRGKANSKKLGRRFGPVRWFTKAEIDALMDEGNSTCSNSQKGNVRLTTMRAGRTSESTFIQSLGTGDRAQAERLLAKLQNEIFENRARGPVPEIETFAGAALRYMEAGGERTFIEPLLHHFGETPLDEIDQQIIDKAAVALYPKCSPATRNRDVYTPVSAILKFAGVTRNIRRPKAPPGIVRWLTHDEAARLIEACAPHLRPLVMFLLLTGARIGEALWLDWRCVDLARAHVSFPKTKNGEPRGVPLHPSVVAALANLPHRDGCVFRRPDGKPYEAGGKIKTAFKAACRRAGIENFRIHDCRHTWATWHYAEHHDLVALQKLGGWKTPAMVMRYAHANVESYRDGINALPSLGAKSVQPKCEEQKAS